MLIVFNVPPSWLRCGGGGDLSLWCATALTYCIMYVPLSVLPPFVHKFTLYSHTPRNSLSSTEAPLARRACLSSAANVSHQLHSSSPSLPTLDPPRLLSVFFFHCDSCQYLVRLIVDINPFLHSASFPHRDLPFEEGGVAETACEMSAGLAGFDTNEASSSETSFSRRKTGRVRRVNALRIS